MEENRMRFAGVRAPQQDDVRILDLAVRTCPASRPENRRQTGDARGVSSPVATIDVVAADHRAHEFLGDVVQLVGCLRAAEHAKRAGAVPLDFEANASRDSSERLLPRRWTVLAVFAYQRSCHSVGRGQFHSRAPFSGQMRLTAAYHRRAAPHMNSAPPKAERRTHPVSAL